jgi:hypothetical protein
LLLLGRIREHTTAIKMNIPDSVRAKWQGRPLAKLLAQSDERLVNVRGGGSYFSFATNSNSYDEQPDVALGDTTLRSAGFYGGTTGILLDLGVVDLDALDQRFTPNTDEEAPRAWELAWTYERKTPATNGTQPLVVTGAEAQQFAAFKYGHQVRAIIGHTYIVRAVLPGEHDHLVAFQIVDQDEHGIFITWRILKTWPK